MYLRILLRKKPSKKQLFFTQKTIMTDVIAHPAPDIEIWGGIECTINRVGDNFYDQLVYADHYNRLGDLDLIAGLGIKKIRYPVLWEKHLSSPDAKIDWRWANERLEHLRKNGIDPIAGLTHH